MSRKGGGIASVPLLHYALDFRRYGRLTSFRHLGRDA